MNKKYFIFGLITIILLGVILGLIFHINKLNKEVENKCKSVTYSFNGKVLFKDSDYLLVETDNIDYIVDTSDTNYEVGDIVEVSVCNEISNNEPKEVLAYHIDLLEDSNSEDDDQNNKDDGVSNSTINSKSNIDNSDLDNNSSNSNNKKNTINEEKYDDKKIVKYFEDLSNDLDNNSSDSSVKEKIKSKFTTIVDFIFYDGTIGGRTFDELSSEAKLKVISLALSIDSKIDNKIPGYKDTISSKYQNIKNKLITKYLDITTNICSNNSDLCDNAKKDFQSMKDSFGITWEVIKNLAGDGLTKLKDWYEIWRTS